MRILKSHRLVKVVPFSVPSIILEFFTVKQFPRRLVVLHIKCNADDVVLRNSLFKEIALIDRVKNERLAAPAGTGYRFNLSIILPNNQTVEIGISLYDCIHKTSSLEIHCKYLQ